MCDAKKETNRRGNRLHPSVFHRSYQHLKQLAEILAAILDEIQLPANCSVLDYGCGNTPYRSLVEHRCKHYVGADLSGNRQADITLTDEGKIPVESGTFDLVLSTQVLEHVPDPRLYLSEAKRVLRDDGLLVLSTHGIYRYHPDPTDYWRWTVEGLRLEIKRAGFRVIDMRSSFRLASVAVQLWQDGISGRLPRYLRLLHTLCCQGIIGLLEYLKKGKFSPDAMVFFVIAEKEG